jgi:ABC-type branched-subunit amino acid transport system ATPase component/ABC-type branched-subunit amino acid transport system permease subunit
VIGYWASRTEQVEPAKGSSPEQSGPVEVGTGTDSTPGPIDITPAAAAVALPARAEEPAERAEVDTSNNPYSKSQPLTRILQNPLNLLVGLVAVFWIFTVADYWVFLASSGFVIGILALGLMVMVGWVREVTLASAAVYGSCLYLSTWIYRDEPGWGLPLIFAIVAAVLIGAGIMLAVSLASVKFSGVYTMVFTLGVQIMCERVVFSQFHLTGGEQNLLNPRPVLFGYTFVGDDRVFYLFLLVCLLFVLALLQRLRHSPYGRNLMLVGADQAAAAAVGISPYKTKALGFGVCGGLAGFAGILAAMLYQSAPTPANYTATTSLLWLSIAILGGFDSMTAVVAVALMFQGVPFMLERLHVNYQMLAGVSLMAGVLFGARGLGGRFQDLYMRFKFGPAVDRRAARSMGTTSAAVLTAGDGIRDLHGMGPNSAVREDALAALEEWFPARRQEGIALSAENIHLAFGGVRALRGASIVVPTGSFTGLIGPNGAGKTTLFDVLSGLQKADQGTVHMFDENVTGMQSWNRARMGLTRTFQTTRVIKDLALSDNLLAGAGVRIDHSLPAFIGGSRKAWQRMRQAEEAAWAIAQLLDISQYWDERVGELEFSARRRAEIGRALLSGPQILLLDEPTSGLDPASSGALISLVRQLQKDLGLTVLLVEHYVKAVLEGCDEVYVLAEGEILAAGAPALIAANPEVQERYLGAGRSASTVPWRERMAAENRVSTRV